MGWYDLNWKYKRTIEINSSSIVGTAAQLGQVPLVFIFSGETAMTSKMGLDAVDVFFTDQTDTVRLPHEITYYDVDLGNMTAWVKVPNLSQNTYQTISMYYGNPSVTVSYEDTSSLWSDYRFVAHLSNYKGRAFRDSSPRPHTASFVSVIGQPTCSWCSAGLGNVVLPLSGSQGKFGGGLEWTPTTKNSASVYWKNGDGYLDTGASLIWSWWANFKALTLPYQTSSNASPTPISKQPCFNQLQPSADSTALYRDYSGCQNGVGYVPFTANVPNNSWHYYIGNWNADLYNTMLFYVDGVAQGWHNTNRGWILSSSMWVGGDTGGGENWSGSLEEVRIQLFALTNQSRITTEYNNQNYAASYKFSPEVSVSPTTGQTNSNLKASVASSSYSIRGGYSNPTASQRTLQIGTGDISLVGGGTADEYVLPQMTCQLAAVDSGVPFQSNQFIDKGGAFIFNSSLIYGKMNFMSITPYSMSYDESMLHVSTSNKSMSVSLPPSVTGQVFIIKDFIGSSSWAAGTVSSSKIIVSSSITQKIDGKGGYIISTSFQAKTFVGDGNNWFTI